MTQCSAIHPKRGRPTFTFIRQDKVSSHQIYTALNSLELMLLELDNTYSILSHDIYADNTQAMSPNDYDHTTIFIQLREFLNMATLQTNPKATQQLISFVQSLGQFLVKEQDRCHSNVYTAEYFGMFFKRKLYSMDAYPLRFYILITVMLGKWLFLMGYNDQEIRERK